MSRPAAVAASRTSLAAVVSAALLAGCAAQDAPEEPINWSAEWFQCESRFDCIAVFDDYCKYSAVNVRYSLVYQDWVRQQVDKSGERRPCLRDRDADALTAYCRNQRCEYP